MKKPWTTKKPAVEFCERCGQVCDAACRANSLAETARDRFLKFRGGAL